MNSCFYTWFSSRRLGVPFLNTIVINSYIAYYITGTCVLFPIENSEVGKNACNPVIRYCKIKNTQLGIHHLFLDNSLFVP